MVASRAALLIGSNAGRTGTNGGRYPAAASSLARANTASIIASVNRPVKVFCWLGWKQPRMVRPSGSTCSVP